jgi:hypothetical protein
VLIVAGCVLAPMSVLAVWTANQVSDTSRYVANVAPLIKDPAIQNALTSKLTSEIVAKIDVKGLTDQAAAGRSHKGLHPDRLATAGRLRLARQRGAGIRAQHHPQDHHRAADGERVGPGEPGG